MLRRLWAVIRGWFKAEPLTVLFKATNGRLTFVVVCATADLGRLSSDDRCSMKRDLWLMATGDAKFILIPPFCRVVISDSQPRYDPPTAGELGL